MAALGGVLAAPLITAFLAMGTTVVIDAFCIIIIGGMGSFLGSLIGSVLVAMVQPSAPITAGPRLPALLTGRCDRVGDPARRVLVRRSN